MLGQTATQAASLEHVQTSWLECFMDIFNISLSRSVVSNSVPLCLTSWENQKISDKTSEKNCRPPQEVYNLGAISKRLKVPHSSVQTTVRKYKHHGTTQTSYRSGRRRVLSPGDERTLERKVQIIPRTRAKDLVKMLEETGTKVSLSRVKRALYRHQVKPLSKEEATAPKPP